MSPNPNGRKAMMPGLWAVRAVLQWGTGAPVAIGAGAPTGGPYAAGSPFGGADGAWLGDVGIGVGAGAGVGAEPGAAHPVDVGGGTAPPSVSLMRVLAPPRGRQVPPCVLAETYQVGPVAVRS
ncbi:hypothetical protein GCM10009867_36120 [Pedococcus aerophilus]|uniref:Uncharacterized protein n=1 Tax=Pedococcus aerophilus TaxID=436356 RepID=A0ABN3UWA1_9MICO